MSNPQRMNEKKETVKTVAQKMKDAKAVYFAEFKGMTVEQVNEFRRTLDKEGVEYKVIKNNILHFAAKEAFPDKDFSSALKGNTGLALAFQDPVTPARVMKEFKAKYKVPNPKLALVEGNIFDAASINRLADLPSREGLLSILVSTIQSPISSFVYALSGIIGEFVYTVEAVKQKKENQQ